ncbi:MAG: alkaline phosphatase family protein, partial [Cyclobacteriaceae bacterium]|nr:alkaline phosphatase family protein [Cyclobacteriaceae bacterium]
PNYYYNYDKSIPDINRLDKAIEWLELPKSERPQLISLYFSLIDDKGHKFGPNSKEIEKAVLEIDEKLGDFFKKLDQLHLPINVIITSDHGMYPLDQSKKIIREDILDWSKIASIPEDAFALIYTKNSFETDSLFTILKSKEKGRYSTYKKNDIPTKLHYKNNDRIGDIVVIANTPYFFTSKKYNDYWGAHGFDPYTNPEMHGIFYANGPAFKAHQEIQSFESIHVYPLIANILQLPYDSLSIDGKPHVLNHLLKD